MKREAIEALQLFKQMHLAQPEPREIQPLEAPTDEPKKRKGVNFNYPDHIKPLKDRMMTAIKNGNRTADSIANYCKADVKLVTLQLGRYVSRGMIGKKTNPQSGITRYYTHAEAQGMGILQQPAPINRKKKAQPHHQPPAVQAPPSVYTAEFLEKRVVEWQKEARRLATENEELKVALGKAEMKLVEARQTRDVTSEVTEVMQEVMQLRGTVAYLESKLFGGK